MAAWKWIVVVAVALVLAALAGLSVYFRPDRAIRVATGAVAHIVCSKSFVSGLDPQTVFAETLERKLSAPVELHDERLTTKLAERTGGEAGADSRAAAHLLDSWLAWAGAGRA